MNKSGLATTLRRIVGASMLAVGVSVFLVRLGHAGPYALPQGGNLAGGLLALALGGWLAFRGPAVGQLERVGTRLVLLASPVILFFTLYATLAEVEEVVVLKATSSSGEVADLRLWIVDLEGFSWIVMPIDKAREHSLDGARLELLREGELRCVETTVESDRETVTAMRATSATRSSDSPRWWGSSHASPAPRRSSCALRRVRIDDGARPTDPLTGEPPGRVAFVYASAKPLGIRVADQPA